MSKLLNVSICSWLLLKTAVCCSRMAGLFKKKFFFSFLMNCIRGAHNLKIGSTSKRKVKVNGGIWISPLVPSHQTTNAHELTQFTYCPVKTIYSCHGLKKDMIFFN